MTDPIRPIDWGTFVASSEPAARIKRRLEHNEDEQNRRHPHHSSTASHEDEVMEEGNPGLYDDHGRRNDSTEPHETDDSADSPPHVDRLV